METCSEFPKYKVGTNVSAYDQWEPFPDGVIIGYTSDGRYRVELKNGYVFEATDWYLETYYNIELPNK